MRNIIVKATEIAKAIAKARKVDSRDWQAECIEILLIPKVYKRWQKVNAKLYKPEIRRHKGKPYTNSVDGHKVEDWSVFAGYVYTYGIPDSDYGWNSVRETSYSHGVSCTWDGIRRETYHSFAENLRLYYYHISTDVKYNVGDLEASLFRHGIHFYNDLDGDVVEGYHGFEEFYTKSEALDKLAEEKERLGNRAKALLVKKTTMSGMWRVIIDATKKPDLEYVSRQMIAA